VRWHGRVGAALLTVLAAAAPAAPATAGDRALYRGTVAIEHEDRGAARAPRETVLLRTAHRTYRVRDPRLRAFVGRGVSLEARRSGRTLTRVRTIVPAARAANHTETWFADPPPAGERRVAVVLISEPGDEALRWDPAVTGDALFGTGDSVDQFFRASSDGRVSIGGDVHGWYTADLGDGCDTYAIANAGVAALEADGVKLSDYHHVMVHFPRRGCGFNGMAWIGDPVSLINGRPSDRRLLTHELGHNFGLYHANAVSCTRDGMAVPLSETCSHHEYGDPFSVMGNGFHRFHAVERSVLPWSARERTLTVNRDGVYEVSGREDSDTEVLSVSRRTDPANWWRAPTHLAVELRRPAPPFDPFASDDPVVSGITVRLVHQMLWQERWWIVGMPMKLLDATPGSAGGHRDAQLRVGDMLVDERSRAAITLESLQDGVARVRVGWVPSRPSGVSAQLDGPDAAHVTWTASEDDEGVVAYEVERDGRVVGRTADLELHDGGLPAGRDLTYRVIALVGHGNRRPSDPVVVTTPPPPVAPPTEEEAPSSIPPPVDRIAPALRLRPAVGRRGRRVPRDRTLELTASDGAVGVRIVALLDGRVLARRVVRRATTGRLVLRLPRAALRGRHRLVLGAVDPAGNRATLRIALTRGRLRRL
jgi:hypothetical protein